MFRSLRIRDVPETIHRRLMERAAEEEISMSEYALRAIQRSLESPGEQKRKMKNATEEIIANPPLSTDPEPSRVLLEERKEIADLPSIGSDAEPSRVLLEERERRRRFLPKRK